jgi:hypothetical protein
VLRPCHTVFLLKDSGRFVGTSAILVKVAFPSKRLSYNIYRLQDAVSCAWVLHGVLLHSLTDCPAGTDRPRLVCRAPILLDKAPGTVRHRISLLIKRLDDLLLLVSGCSLSTLNAAETQARARLAPWPWPGACSELPALLVIRPAWLQLDINQSYFIAS